MNFNHLITFGRNEIGKSFVTLSGLFDIREIYVILKLAQENNDDNSLLFIQIFTLVAAVFNTLVLFLEFIGMILICRGVSGYNDCSCCCTCCIGENQVNLQGNWRNYVNNIFYILYKFLRWRVICLTTIGCNIYSLGNYIANRLHIFFVFTFHIILRPAFAIKIFEKNFLALKKLRSKAEQTKFFSSLLNLILGEIFRKTPNKAN